MGSPDQVLNDLKDIGAKIEKFFKGLGQLKGRMEKILESGKLTSIGIGHGVEAVGKSFWMSTYDIGDIIWMSGQFTFQWITCMIELSKNLRKCFLFYLADIIGQFFSLIITMSVFIVKYTTGIDLQETLLFMWNVIDDYDASFHGMTGYHFAHFPDSVHQACYTCPNGFKISDSIENLKNKAYTIDRDFNVTIPEMYNLPTRELKQANRDFKDAIKPQ